MPEERQYDYLSDVDIAMNLMAYNGWKVAYGRGLVTERELSCYLKRCEDSPISWIGWLRWDVSRAAGNGHTSGLTGDELAKYFEREVE